MATVAYPLRISDKLMGLAELRTKEEYVDKATAIRQLLYKGAEDYVLELYLKGRLSLSNAAEILDKSVHDILRLVQELGLESGLERKLTKEQYEISKKTVKLLKS